MECYYIYLITNKLNGKTYVGQHKVETLKKDSYFGSGIYLKRAIDKYGQENFEKTVLKYCETREQADFLEKKYISFYRLGGFAEYNIADGGEGGKTWDQHGVPKSEIQKINQSRTMKEKYRNGLLQAPYKGETRSSTHKKNISVGTKKAMTNLPAATKRKLVEGGLHTKGLLWWNNGQVCVRAKTQPEGFKKGRLWRTNKDEITKNN